jgi:hypothetical protein
LKVLTGEGKEIRLPRAEFILSLVHVIFSWPVNDAQWLSGRCFMNKK